MRNKIQVELNFLKTYESVINSQICYLRSRKKIISNSFSCMLLPGIDGDDDYCDHDSLIHNNDDDHRGVFPIILIQFRHFSYSTNRKVLLLCSITSNIFP